LHIGTNVQASNTEVPLSGELAVGGTVDKNGIANDGESRFHFNITGEAAKTMYQTLSVDSFKDDCTGFTRKNAGNISCFAKPIQQEYSCSFAINIELSRLESNSATCR